MAGLDPATQSARVRATERPSLRKDFIGVWIEFPARTDVRALGGRVKPGHDEFFLRLASRTNRPAWNPMHSITLCHNPKSQPDSRGPRAGHPADSRPRGEETWLVSSSGEPLRRVDTRRLGGRVAHRLPGHDEIFWILNLNRTAVHDRRPPFAGQGFGGHARALEFGDRALQRRQRIAGAYPQPIR